MASQSLISLEPAVYKVRWTRLVRQDLSQVTVTFN